MLEQLPLVTATVTRDSSAWPDGSRTVWSATLLETWKRERLFEQTLEHTREREALRFLRGAADRQRPSRHPSRLLPHHQGPGLPLPRPAGQAGHPDRRLGHPRASGRDRGREVAQPLRQEGHRGIRRRASSTPCAARASSPIATSGRRSPTGSPTGSTRTTPTSPVTPGTSSRSGRCSRRCTAKTCLPAGHRVLPYCPRCGTVLSSHELSQGYENGA